MSEVAKRCSRVTRAQKDCLVQFMDDHKEFARGQFNCPNSLQSSQDMWNLLTSNLNAMGPIVKTSEQWKKCWTDLKSGVRKLCNSRRAFLNRTGGGSIVDAPRELNDLEEKILAIISTHAVDGDGLTPESGVASNIPIIEIKPDPINEVFPESQPKKLRTTENVGYKSALAEAQMLQEAFELRFQKLEESTDTILAQNQNLIHQNKALKRQNEEIMLQNNEIKAQNENLVAQLSIIFKQNEDIINVFKSE